MGPHAPHRAPQGAVQLCLLALSLVLVSCGRPRIAAQPEAPRSDTLTPPPVVAAAAPESTLADSTVADTAFVRYTRIFVRNKRDARRLADSLGAANWFEVLKVNRVDLAHVRNRDSLVVPEAFGDSLTLSPFPRVIPALRDTAKLLLVSIRVQAFAAYDSGQLVRWGPTSTGRKDMPTPTGLYHTNWKEKERISTFNDEWQLKWYINLHNFEGVSFHEYELPGHPASHSCARLLEADAIWLYSYSQQWRLGADPSTILHEGTPVVVFGDWAWGKHSPWKKLPVDAQATTLTDAEIDDALRMLAERTQPRFEHWSGKRTSDSARAGADRDSTGVPVGTPRDSTPPSIPVRASRDTLQLH